MGLGGLARVALRVQKLLFHTVASLLFVAAATTLLDLDQLLVTNNLIAIVFHIDVCVYLEIDCRVVNLGVW